MIERRRSLRLTHEPVAALSIRLIREDHFYRHRPPQPIIGGFVHSSHRAGAQLGGDDVVAERPSGKQQQQRSCGRLVERHEAVNHGRRTFAMVTSATAVHREWSTPSICRSYLPCGTL